MGMVHHHPVFIVTLTMAAFALPILGQQASLSPLSQARELIQQGNLPEAEAKLRGAAFGLLLDKLHYSLPVFILKIFGIKFAFEQFYQLLGHA